MMDIAVIAIRPCDIKAFVASEKVNILYSTYFDEIPDQDYIANLYTELRDTKQIEGDFKLIICGPETTRMIKETDDNI